LIIYTYIQCIFWQFLKINLYYRKIPGLIGIESIQARLLDAFGPLAALHSICHEALAAKGNLDPRQALEAVNSAIAFVGNSNAQACYERRRLILRKINPELGSYATKSEITSTTTDLFGDGLRKTIKESIDLNKEVSGFARLTGSHG